MKDEVPLGKLAPEGATRDAIHLAVAPVIAGERLAPGQHVRLSVDNPNEVLSCTKDEAIGIVDPFLWDAVRKGDRLYTVLLPNTITGMHHEWTHPAFTETRRVVDVGGSEKWLTDYCHEIGCRRDEIMDAAENFLRSGNYWCEGGRWDGCYLSDDFWMHYEIITGKAVPEDSRSSFFSCSC